MKFRTKYYSTNHKSNEVTFREALLKGLAPDGGLYMPAQIPFLNADELESLSALDYPSLAARIIGMLTGDDISKNELLQICREVYRFPVHFDHIAERKYIMHLDQGPTASFKDFAALMMGRLMQYFLNIEKKNITILTATSGDTGSAVANAFHGLKNINVIILFPFSEVSDLQRRQMTTFNGNIQVIAIDGKFDDCQRLVKQAFMDPGLSGLNLSSANSINIGRLIPQSVYYFYAWSRLAGIISEKIIFSVPCGNFGNAAGGIIARKMGLPVSRFVISTNENDEVPSYLRTGVYKPVIPSKNCISSAMNVGHPSNLARIIELYGGKMDEEGNILKLPELEMMRKDLFAVSISDVETKKGIRSFYDLYGKILEPHGAVAWIGLQEYLKVSTDSDYSAAVSLETAHPAKFREEIKSIIDKEPDLPDSLLKIEAGTEEYISLENYYETLKNFIIKNH